MSTTRNVIPGIVLRPEVHKISNNKLNWYATRYIIYKDRARLVKEFDDTFTGNSKESFSYSKEFTDDRVLFFTTNIQLNDGTWCGESPLTPVVLRKTRVSSSGIIITPEVATTKVENSLILKGSEYIRYEGQALHHTTDWIIEDDITGEVKLKREKDREHLTELRIDKIDLDPNRPYRVKVRYEDVLGKTSNYGSCLLITGTILDDLIPSSSYIIPYGDTLKIETENNVSYLIDSDLITMDVYKNNNLIKTLEYDKGFYVNSLDYSLGDRLKAKVKYMDISKDVEILIINKDIESGDIDTSFEIKGLYKNINADDFLLSGVSTAKQMDDGYIYDIDPVAKKLVRIEYDEVLNKLNKLTDVLDLSSVTTGSFKYRTIFINPYGGLILYISGVDDVYTAKSTTQRIVFVDILNGVFVINKVVSIDHHSFGCTYNNNSYIDGNNLVLYNKMYYDNRTMLKIFSIDMLNKTVTDNDKINMDYTSLNGYAPIKINGEVLLAKAGIETSEQTYRNVKHIISLTSSLFGSLPLLVDDEFLYYFYAGEIRKLNIITGQSTYLYTGLVNDGYTGGYRSPVNGKIYFVPTTAQNVLVIDPKTDNITFLTNTTHIPANNNIKWRYGCMASNGKLYCCPHGVKHILIIDTNTDTINSVAVTSALTTGLWSSAVEGENYIYFAPFYENRILTIRMSDNSISYIPVPGLATKGHSYGGYNGYYSKDLEKIFFNSVSAKDVLVLHTDNNSVSNIFLSDVNIPADELPRHHGLGMFNTNLLYIGAGYEGMIRFIDMNTEQVIGNQVVTTDISSTHGSIYIPNQLRFVTIYRDLINSNNGYINTFLPDASTMENVLINRNKNLNIKKTIPNPINVVNASLISRLVKLKNAKPAFILAPSSDNTKAGVVEIDPITFELTDKRVDITATTAQRIVYTLKDGRIITANNNKAVLFY